VVVTGLLLLIGHYLSLVLWLGEGQRIDTMEKHMFKEIGSHLKHFLTTHSTMDTTGRTYVFS
jgi:hypothetical protein